VSPRFNFRSAHHLEATEAYVLFDMKGNDTDAVMAWRMRHPAILVSTEGSLASPVFQPAHGYYHFELDGLARGMWMPRPRWDAEQLSPPRLELPDGS